MAMMGLASSRAAFIAAATGGVPSSRCRFTFSTTMMASSTTKPIASTSASKVSKLMEKPSASMIASVPTNESGMATTGISTERGEPKNAKMTHITMNKASINVTATS